MRYFSRLKPTTLLLAVFFQPFLSEAQRTINSTLALPTELPTGNYDLEVFGNFSTVLAIANPLDERNTLYFAERSGRIIVYSDLENQIREQDPFLIIPSTVTTNGENGLLGLAFHPQYRLNGYFFVFYTSQRENGERTNRISRFSRSQSDPFLANSNSALILFDQVDQASNHNGGDIHFGPDGYLYISLGDEGAGNDSYNNSQVVDGDLFAGIARIDVDKLPGNLEPTNHPDIPRNGEGKAYYSIPIDNPLVSKWQDEGSNPESDLRLEFYAIGLRNPWRMSFDPATGNLWTGDVGQGSREEIDVIIKGANYGWAFREGFVSGPKNQTPPAGFESVADPIHDYPRSQGVSVTGGVVYRGSRLPELEGAYIFGDYGSGRIWALFPDPNGGAPSVEQITSVSNPVAFARDPINGDILVSTISGSVRRLVRGSGEEPVFPETLTQTGAFKSLATLEPEDGIIAYEPNVSFWSDHAAKQRWVAVPEGIVAFSEDDPWTFPTGTVWIKHFELDLERGNPQTSVRIETRFLVKTPTSIYGLSYRWNEDQTEAYLVANEGEDILYNIQDEGEQIEQNWRIPSRQECLQCHTVVAGYALSFNARQLNRTLTINENEQNILSYFSEIGILDTAIENPQSVASFAQLDDPTKPLREKVRSYLAVNCVSCHQPGGTAPSNWDARPHIPIENMGIINGSVVDNRGNSNRRLVIPGSNELSVLLSRVQGSHGYQRMPPIGSNVIDEAGIQLLSDWISLVPPTDSSFEEWQITFFGSANSSDAAASADPDRDGNSNLLEFMTFTHRLNSEDFWHPEIAQIGRQAQVRFAMPPSRNYEIQISYDLENWDTWIVPGNPPQSDPIEEIQVNIEGLLPESANNSFLRIQITSEPQ